MTISNAEETYNVEELRLSKVADELPDVLIPLNDNLQEFTKALGTVENETELRKVVKQYSNRLWQTAASYIKTDQKIDDRPLYWQRLAYRKALKDNSVYKALGEVSQGRVLDLLEVSSRGFDDINFQAKADFKILLTGFDPFFLDRNLDQSNPSGVTVMLLDGQILEFEGKTAEIQSAVYPVRYTDFDSGLVENNLSKYYSDIDMLATVSMGRMDFDLERFPGLRRSAEAPDNLNIYTGATKKTPLIPMLGDKPLSGEEFVEFSLPVAEMQKAQGKFKVIDNHKVTTLEMGDIEPKSLTELSEATSVSGSGGGYLSNEISYRTVRLRNQLNPELPVGHIHTPRIKAFEPDTSRHIALQIKEMLRLSLQAL